MEKIETKILEFKKTEIDETIDWTRTNDVTAEEVRLTKGMEHLTQGQAEEVTQFIKTFAMLLNTLIEKQTKEENNIGAKVIPLYGEEQIKKAA